MTADTASRPAARDPRFAPTRWSLIAAACEAPAPAAQAALEELCRAYWYPLYAFVRRSGHAPADAQDLTQAFFARLLEKAWLRDAQPERGRFRSFLLVALKRFLAKEWRHACARRRGGGWEVIALDAGAAEARYAIEPGLAPDAMFERRWALTLLDRALARLAADYATPEAAREFALLKEHLTAGRGEVAYDDTARALGTTPGAARVAVHRLRRRFRTLLREEIAHTLADPAMLDDELRHFAAVLGGPA